MVKVLQLVLNKVAACSMSLLPTSILGQSKMGQQSNLAVEEEAWLRTLPFGESQEREQLQRTHLLAQANHGHSFGFGWYTHAPT